MKKKSAAAAQGRSDASNWRTNSQKKDDKKDITVPKTGGLCTIVPKDKDLLLSCIDKGKLTLANDVSISYGPQREKMYLRIIFCLFSIVKSILL